jgi:hypothetical protein
MKSKVYQVLGAGWFYYAAPCRLMSRGCLAPGSRFISLGFRIAMRNKTYSNQK